MFIPTLLISPLMGWIVTAQVTAQAHVLILRTRECDLLWKKALCGVLACTAARYKPVLADLGLKEGQCSQSTVIPCSLFHSIFSSPKAGFSAFFFPLTPRSGDVQGLYIQQLQVRSLEVGLGLNPGSLIS